MLNILYINVKGTTVLCVFFIFLYTLQHQVITMPFPKLLLAFSKKKKKKRYLMPSRFKLAASVKSSQGKTLLPEVFLWFLFVWIFVIITLFFGVNDWRTAAQFYMLPGKLSKMQSLCPGKAYRENLEQPWWSGERDHWWKIGEQI